MVRITWFPETVERVLRLIENFTLEEVGAAEVVRALIVANQDHLRDDDRFIAGNLRLDIRVWRRIKRKLVQGGELTVEGDFLRGREATEMVADIVARMKQRELAGRRVRQVPTQKVGSDIE